MFGLTEDLKNMVPVKQVEDKCPFEKFNASSETSKCHQMNPRDIRTYVYRFAVKGNNATGEEEQSLLDALILSQWEDRSCKGQLAYDVTMCETQIINGGKNFIAQLNEKWNASSVAEFENNTFKPLGSLKLSYMKLPRDNLLCVATEENENSELVLSTTFPADGTLVMVNVNPVEYGHIFLVPYNIRQKSRFVDKKVLHMVFKFASEIGNHSFRVFFDHNVSTDYMYFQAAYFANYFPVELLPTMTIYNNMDNGVKICEISDYPLNALMFTGHNSNTLAELIAKICFSLQQDNNIAFSLLLSDCATKMYLFPQVHQPVTGKYLSSWECGGYFVYNTSSEFENASESEVSERLAAASIDNKSFQALKQLCCNLAL